MLLFVVNENNGNPTYSLLDSKVIRKVVVIRPNLIGHYFLGNLYSKLDNDNKLVGKGLMRGIETSRSLFSVQSLTIFFSKLPNVSPFLPNFFPKHC